jgi:glycosyltransferase involved in cell wall biosynthesis
MPRPFVVTVYDLTFIRYPERLAPARRLYLRLLTGSLARPARARHFAIDGGRSNDAAGHPGDRIDLALPGVDPRFRPLPPSEVEAWRERMGLPRRFLLFVGTLEPRKNLSVLLRAYAALPAADHEAVHLVLAGGKGWLDEYTELLRLIDRHGLTSTVHLPGFVADDDLVWWYNAAEAFVYPSVFEGWGMPVTEAMACGKPVIVSDVSSLPEAAGDAGLRLPPHDLSAWTDALARCVGDIRSGGSWLAERGAAGLARAAGFTWARTAECTVRSYRKALGLQLSDSERPLGFARSNHEA